MMIDRDAETGLYVLLDGPDKEGIWDLLGEYQTRDAAHGAKREMLRERAATYSAERHYWAQYAYACGYHD